MRSNLLINEPPLQVLPTLAKTIGLNEAIILQQVHYWLNPQLNKNIFEGRHWVHNTFNQWEQQFAFWSKKTIMRTIAILEDAGFLISFVTRDFKKTKYYTLDYGALNRVCPSDPSTYDANDTQGRNTKTFNTPESAEKQGTCPWGQNDPIERDNLTLSIGTKCPHREGQSDLIDRDKLSSFHYTENTTEITSENTLSPLTPPSSFAASAKKEEEEEEEQKIIYFPSKPLSLAIEPYQQMLESWNRIVQNKLHPGMNAHLTSKRKQLLEHFLQTVLNGQIEPWQDYCRLIADSRFLAGQNPTGFRVTLDWALVPDNAYKILEGAIYDKPELVKDQPNNLSWEGFAEELARTLPSSPCLLSWLKISMNLAELIGQLKYRSWFSKVLLKELTPTQAIFEVEGRFIKDYITSHFSSELQKALHTHYPTVDHFEFKLVSSIGSNK